MRNWFKRTGNIHKAVHVSVDKARGTLDLRQREYTPKRERPLWGLVYKLRYILGFVVAATVAITIVVISSTSNAQVTKFYPDTCLGDWNGTTHAQGEPDARFDAYSPTKTAVSEGGEEGIFCGSFTGEVYEGTQPSRAVLMFEWKIGEEPRKEEPTEEEKENLEEFGTTTEDILPFEPIEEEPEPETEEQTDTFPIEVQGEVEPAPEQEEGFFDRLLMRLGSRVFAQNATTTLDEIEKQEETATTTEEETEPEEETATTTEEETEPEEEVATTTVATTTSATTTLEDTQQTEDGTGQASTTTVATSTQTVPEPEPETEYEESETLLDVLYTLDGTSWELLAHVTEDNWENSLFPIPITSWSELANLQIQLRNAEGDTPIYLDAMWVEITYEEGPYDIPIPLELEQLQSLPKEAFYIGEVGQEKHFGANETVDFTIAVPRLTPSILSKFAVVDASSTATTTFETNASTTVATTSLGFTIEVPKEDTTSTDDLTEEEQKNLEEFGTTTEDILIFGPIEEESEETEEPQPNEYSGGQAEETQQATTTSSLPGFLGQIAHAQMELSPQPPIQPPAQSPTLTFAGTPRVVSTRLIGPRGKVSNVPMSTSVNGGTMDVQVFKPERGFKPGRYRLQMEIEQDGIFFISEQSFLWGVLAINVNKATYRTGEEAYIQIATLNESGFTQCNSELHLEMTSPSGDVEVYATDDETLIKSETCGADNVTDHPDYFVRHILSEEGTYTLELTNLDTDYSVSDEFTANNEQLFYVERVGATRINPFKSAYNMELRVTATEAFTGEIVEKLPPDFVIIGTGGADVESEADVVELRWQADLLPGEEKSFWYTYEAPEITPELFFLGPVSITETGFSLLDLFRPVSPDFGYEEGRQWQLASDAVGDVDLGRWTGGVKTQGNLSETWAVPNNLFNIETRNDGNTYTFTVSNSTLTLPSPIEADGYLMVARFEYHDASNGRFNPQCQIVQTGGTGNFVGPPAGGYERNNNNDQAFVSCWMFVDNPSSSATFQFQWKADADDADASSGTQVSSFDVIPLYYAEHGLYTSTSASLYGGTTPNQVTGWSVVDESDTNAIEHSSNVVTVKNDNKRFLVFSGQFYEGRGGRTQRWFGHEYDNTQDNAAKAYTYYRNTSNDESGNHVFDLIETDTANRTIEVTAYRGDGISNNQGGADSDGSTPGVGDHGLVVLELNDTAEVWRSHNNSTQDLDTGGIVDINLSPSATVDFNDAASFTRASDSAVNAEVDMDALFGANISAASRDVSPNERFESRGAITVNSTEDTHVMHGNYFRNNQGSIDTFGHSQNPVGFLALSSGDDIGASSNQTGDGGPVTAQSGWTGFWGINLDTIAPASVNTVQDHWRWRADDGSESAATFTNAEDTASTTLQAETNIRLRFQVDNTGGAATDYNYRLEWAAQGADNDCDTSFTNETYAAVPDVATTEHFNMVTSSNFADGDATTAQLTTDSLTFVAGDMVESTSNQTGNITLAEADPDEYTEVEFAFQANANATYGGNYCFRVTDAGTLLDQYDTIASSTLQLNPVPSISDLSLNGGTDITLLPGTFKWASSTMTITDGDDCGDISSVTAKAYLASTTNDGTTCTYDGNDCYPSVSCVATSTDPCDVSPDKTVDYECGFKFWYIAEPTDAGGWDSSIWSVSATSSDGVNEGTATNTSETVEVASLVALDVTTDDIEYGSIEKGTDTGSTNQVSTTTNVGNRSIDADIGGDNMKDGANTIGYEEQKYSSTTFTYSTGGVVLTASTSPLGLELDLAKPTSTTTPVEAPIYWGINVPSGQINGTYEGTNYYTACLDGACSGTLEFDYLFSNGTNVYWNEIDGGTAVSIGNFGVMNGAGRQLVKTSAGDLYSFLNKSGQCSVMKSSDGSSWAEQDSSNRPACLSGSEVSVAVDSSDDLHLMYGSTTPAGGAGLGYVKFTTSSDTYGSTEVVDDNCSGIGCSQSSIVDITIDSNDVPHIAYLEDSLVGPSIVYGNRVGGSWTANVTVDSSLSSPQGISTTMNEDDKAEIATVDSSGLSLNYYLAYNNDPSTLQFDQVTIESGTVSNISLSSIAVDTSGNTWIGYLKRIPSGGIGTTTLIQRLDASATSTWETAVQSDNAAKSGPSIALDGTDVYIFYEDDNDDIAYDIYTGSWSGETVLETGTFQDVKAKWSFNNKN